MLYLIFSKLKILNLRLKIPSKQAGFSMTELIVVMAIASVIMTTIVVQQSQWNKRLAVNTQAYELALMIRQAQIYSLGVKEYTAGAGDKFDIGYGVHIGRTGPLSDKYILFADKDKDLLYDDPVEKIEEKVFKRKVK